MFIDKIKEQSCESKVIIYSDMDGVIAEYGVGEKPLIMSNEKSFYLNKRPIYSTINKLKELSEIENVEIGIMSNCYFQEQKTDKIEWLKEYCPFISPENINIIVLNEESYTKETKDYLKVNRIIDINKDNDKVWHLVEDNHNIMNCTNKVKPGFAHHFSELLD